MFSQAAPPIYLHPGVGRQLFSIFFHTQASFSLAEHSNPLTALHPQSPLYARSGSNILWVTLTQEIHSERRVILYSLGERSDQWQEPGNSHLLQQDLYNASIHMVPQFVLGYAEFYWKSYTDFINDHTDTSMTDSLFSLFNSKNKGYGQS